MSRKNRIAIITYLLAAMCGWSGLVLRTAVLFDELGWRGTIIRFIDYLSLWATIAASTACLHAALIGTDRTRGARIRFMVLVTDLLVGVAYSLLMRGKGPVPGLPLLTNYLTHVFLPILFTAAWLVDTHGTLHERDAFKALIPPFAYLLCAMVKGYATQHFSYWFIDPYVLGPFGYFAMIGTIIACVYCVARILVWIDRRLAGEGRQSQLSSNSA